MDPRYTLVGCSFVIQGVVIGSMFAYGVFLPFLEAEFGWSRALLSSTLSTASLVMGVFAIGGGHLVARYGPRWVLSVTGVICGLGYVLTGTLSAPWQLFVYFGLMVGIGMSTHDVGTLPVVARIFDKRRGAMTGVVKVGTAVGQIIIPYTATVLIAGLGWRCAAIALGCGGAVLLLLAAQGLNPSRIRRPGGPEHAGAAPRSGYSLRQVLSRRTFWTLCVTQFTFMPALITIPLHLPVHGTDLGMTVTAAAALLSVIGATSVAGRLVIGRIADWLGGRRALSLCLVLLSTSLALVPALTSATALYGFAVLYGFAHGGLFTVISPTVAEYFGMRAHGAIFGAIVFCGTLGAAAGPMAAGWIFDVEGSYALAFWGLAGLSAVAFALIATLPAGESERKIS